MSYNKYVCRNQYFCVWFTSNFPYLDIDYITNILFIDLFIISKILYTTENKTFK